MAEKIGNEMQTQGIKMKRPAIPTKVCRFPSHNCGLKSTYWNLLCMILQSWTKSVQKFALSYSQDTHPANLVPHWSLPPPLPGQRCSVRSKNVPAALQHCFLGGKRGSMLSELCFTGMYSEIRHTTWGICLNTFVQDCRFPHYLLFSLPDGSTYNLRSSAAPLFFVPKESRTFQHSAATVSI